MPRSKRPRKPGRHGAINRKHALAKKMNLLTTETVERLADGLEKEAA